MKVLWLLSYSEPFDVTGVLWNETTRVDLFFLTWWYSSNVTVKLLNLLNCSVKSIINATSCLVVIAAFKRLIRNDSSSTWSKWCDIWFLNISQKVFFFYFAHFIWGSTWSIHLILILKFFLFIGPLRCVFVCFVPSQHSRSKHVATVWSSLYLSILLWSTPDL